MVAQADDVRPHGQDAPQKRQQIGTALISATVTIVAALIGVLPQMRDKDSKIDHLQQQVSQLKQQPPAADDLGDKGLTPPAKALAIAGNVLDLKTKLPLGGVDVFLIPLSNPKLMARTDKAGAFRFPNAPDQRYWIVVRDSKSGNSSAGFVDEDNDEATFETGAVIKYSVKK